MKIDLSVITQFSKKTIIGMIIAALLGAIWFVMIRAVFVETAGPHYHANFALFVDGEREMFEESFFYEEISSCGNQENNPKVRVHMHDNIPDVVHVHEASSTWGNFFENIGFTLGNNVLYERTNTHVNGNGGKLSFVLNGDRVTSIANRPIESEDVLLISYGNESGEALNDQYNVIDQNADIYNQTADPSACQGTKESSYWQRIQIVLGIK